jgi:hypothetical protein
MAKKLSHFPMLSNLSTVAAQEFSRAGAIGAAKVT